MTLGFPKTHQFLELFHPENFESRHVAIVTFGPPCKLNSIELRFAMAWHAALIVQGSLIANPFCQLRIFLPSIGYVAVQMFGTISFDLGVHVFPGLFKLVVLVRPVKADVAEMTELLMTKFFSAPLSS
jgi:hypothetical protein